MLSQCHQHPHTHAFICQRRRLTVPDVAQMAALYREMEALKLLPVQHTEAELATRLTELGDHMVLYRCRDAGGLCWRFAPRVYLGRPRGIFWLQPGPMRVRCMPRMPPSVYDFKQGTGAHLVECLGEWEWASLPGMCWVVNVVLKRRGSA